MKLIDRLLTKQEVDTDVQNLEVNEIILVG